MRGVQLNSMIHKNLTEFKRQTLNKIIADRHLKDHEATTDCNKMEQVNRDNFKSYLNTLCTRKEKTYADGQDGTIVPQGVIFEQLKTKIAQKISNAVL